MSSADDPDLTPADDDAHAGARVLVWLTIVASVAGAITGFVGGAFRWLLVRADEMRLDIGDWAHHHGFAALLVPVAISAAAAAVATAITRWEPRAAGSGIQHVEAVERGEAEPPSPRVVPARFVGGLIAIGCGGLVLGREGPTVHMGAAIGTIMGRVTRCTRDEIRVLQTVLSGTGLAVAFNAPISGALFCIEEIAKTVKLRYVLWTMASVAVGTACSRVVVGNHPDFTVPAISTPALASIPVFVVFGAIVGVLGVAYNWLIRACLTTFQAIDRVPGPAKAAVVGGVVGAMLMINPDLGGGGDDLTQALFGGHRLAIGVIVLYLAVRFFAGPVSYSAGTPGGIFAPMIALGGLSGLLAARIIDLFAPGYGHDLMIPLMIVGMSTLFTAVVRAPFTGAVLVMEMTSTTNIAVALLAGGAAAMIVSQLLNSPPIYDDLRERMLAQWKGREGEGV
ncbi:ClC family H(+)/Cl(-) exchange transporter [Gordonia sp. VNK1]|uniref:ClC family H(+)/Cl(-) exchange transporter n=1 Tax=Gordonia oleivorans TaxID=3156618 RepID=UPI0032B58336